MSSGRFDYTAEERSKLLGQFSDAMKLTHEQLRPADRISSALQSVISDDDIIVVPKVAQTLSGRVFHVTGNARTAADAIAATNCPVRWGLAETPAKIPMTLQPVDCRVRVVPLGRVMTAEEIYNIPRIVTPAEFFAFGAKFPEEQKVVPHITVWLAANGQFFYGSLDVYDDERYVNVRQCNPDHRFSGACCVLVRE